MNGDDRKPPDMVEGQSGRPEPVPSGLVLLGLVPTGQDHLRAGTPSGLVHSGLVASGLVLSGLVQG